MNELETTKFHEGELYDAYRYFGCQIRENAGEGIFRVFAPSAKRVSLIGDFSAWQEIPMNNIGDGIYEAKVKSVKIYDGYKYKIYTADGRELFKSDPYAFHSETNEGTNSKAYPLSLISVNDEDYQQKKANKNTRQKDGCNLCCALIVKFCF